jgi:hypothetical protein
LRGFPMLKRLLTAMVIVGLAIPALVVYVTTVRPESESPFASLALTPSPMSDANREAAYAAAQATLAAGQSEIMELSHQATVVSLSRDQAAKAAAQATLDSDQRELMELSIQATEISQNMAQAAATQQFITDQNQMTWEAAAVAQSQAATATYSAYILNLGRSAQTAEANATLTAYSLTATPWAVIQADIARTQEQAERRALWNEFVVTPVTLFLLVLVALLLIAGAVIAYLRLMPVLELRLRTMSRVGRGPLLLVDGMVVHRDPQNRRSIPGQPGRVYLPPLPSGGPVHVEVVDPSEPSVVNWITEAEQKLLTDGWIRP